MTVTRAQELLAQKFMHKRFWDDVLVPDSMRAIVALAYTDEEAELVNALGLAPLPARIIARQVRRPVAEVRPLLDSLAERQLIVQLTIKGVKAYGFLNFLPGVYELQMIRAADVKAEAELEYYRRFAELYHELYDEIIVWLKPRLEGKDLRFGRIIPVNKSLDNSGGVVPLPSDQFSEIVDRNNSFCLVNVCACRNEMVLLGQGCGKPLDVCSGMGWVADYLIDRGLARRVTKQEFLETKQRAAEAGLVNFCDNLVNPLQMCSCCSCCCSGLRALKKYNIPTIIAPSRFEAVVDRETCNACGKCAKACPMDAISWTKKQPPARVDLTRCIGCGVCVNACDKEQAMSLRERPNHKPPSATAFDYFADRYLEINDDAGLAPRLGLGIGRLLGKLSPFSISGPGYHPPEE